MKLKSKFLVLGLFLTLFITACEGVPLQVGGVPVQVGLDSEVTTITQTEVSLENVNCFLQISGGDDLNENGVLDAEEVTQTSYVCNPAGDGTRVKYFNRIATYAVCSQLDATCNVDDETAAEIVAASSDGMTLIYSDSPLGQLGFVDITDPAAPVGLGTLELGGEPTSVAVAGDYALTSINTSADFVDVSGELIVVDVVSQEIVATYNLGGQPDSIAVSPDGAYAVVVIENERDEDLEEGIPPQLPGGAVVTIDLAGEPTEWITSTIDVTGLADLFPEDPEPEYVDINEDNIAVITMQENNHILLLDVASGEIVNSFSAGAADLTAIDATEEDPAIIAQTESQEGVVREPDGVTWISTELFATADEGDMDGGSRGYTIFNTDGEVVYTAGNSLDHYAARIGHYPDGRSGNKGNEPENAEYGVFGDTQYLFVASERSSLIFVYDVADPASPVLTQVLPTAVGPEGVLAIPSRGLLVVASEVDERGAKMRSALNIYSYEGTAPTYPTIISADREDGSPIPWSAMSGLAAHSEDSILYAIEDSFYGQNRIFTIDVSTEPAQLIAETTITDANDVFAGIAAAELEDDSVEADDPTRIEVFDTADLASLINEDKSINIDPEGIAVASDGGFWVASEGSGTIGDEGRPINTLNFIFKTDADGVIEEVITLPEEVNTIQLRFGFEGVAEYDGSVYVAFQRAWGEDENPRIGIYDLESGEWSFVFYPLEEPASQNGGWVGLSDITSLGDGTFLVVERDNQGGPDAAIKHLYTIDLNDVEADSTVEKTFVRDLMDDLAATGALTFEKIEGSAILSNGDVYIINDNDGVDDNSGETQLINLGSILE